MALRRPPTRLELKADDIEEYNEIVREREMAMADGDSTTNTSTGVGGGDGGRYTPGGVGKSPLRKASAAERIGISRPR